MADNWDDDAVEMVRLAAKYTSLETAMARSPVERTLSPPPRKERPLVPYVRDDTSDNEAGAHGRPLQLFFPSLQRQRNTFVLNTLQQFRNKTAKPLVSLGVLGCGELSLERNLMLRLNSLGIVKVFSVDQDEEPLSKGIRCLEQLQYDYHDTVRDCFSDPVHLQQFLGSIIDYDDRLQRLGCVCSTEVIEHMQLEDATMFMRNVLSNIQPKLFIISTPNHEYNQAFNSPPGTFRHDDHKFEFSREEFANWVRNVVSDYPVYDYRLEYVGVLRGYEHLSGATQFAVIERDLREKRFKVAHARSYSKVAESISYHGLHQLVGYATKLAFIEWVKKARMEPETLEDGVWKCRMRELVPMMNVPDIVKRQMDPQFMVLVLRSATLYRLSYGKDRPITDGDEKPAVTESKTSHDENEDWPERSDEREEHHMTDYYESRQNRQTYDSYPQWFVTIPSSETKRVLLAYFSKEVSESLAQLSV